MTVVVKIQKQGIQGNLNYRIYSVSIGSGDTEIVVNTGWRRILHHSISPTSVASKYITRQQISGGILTLTTTNPGEAETFTVRLETDWPFR
jgi:hypothetical protein